MEVVKRISASCVGFKVSFYELYQTDAWFLFSCLRAFRRRGIQCVLAD